MSCARGTPMSQIARTLTSQMDACTMSNTARQHVCRRVDLRGHGCWLVDAGCRGLQSWTRTTSASVGDVTNSKNWRAWPGRAHGPRGQAHSWRSTSNPTHFGGSTPDRRIEGDDEQTLRPTTVRSLSAPLLLRLDTDNHFRQILTLRRMRLRSDCYTLAANRRHSQHT